MSPDPRALVAGLRRVGLELAKHSGAAAPFVCVRLPLIGRIDDVDAIALGIAKPDLLRVLPECPIAHGPDG